MNNQKKWPKIWGIPDLNRSPQLNKSHDDLQAPSSADKTGSTKQEEREVVKRSGKKNQSFHETPTPDNNTQKHELHDHFFTHVNQVTHKAEENQQTLEPLEPINVPSQSDLQMPVDDLSAIHKQEDVVDVDDSSPFQEYSKDELKKSALNPKKYLNQISEKQISSVESESRIRYITSDNEKVSVIQVLTDQAYKKDHLLDIKQQVILQLKIDIAEYITKNEDLENQLRQEKKQATSVQDDLKSRLGKMQTQKLEVEGQLSQAQRVIQTLKDNILEKDDQIFKWINYHDEDLELVNQLQIKIIQYQEQQSKFEQEKLSLNNFLKLNQQQIEEFKLKNEQLLNVQKNLQHKIIDLESWNHQVVSKKEQITLQLYDGAKEVEETKNKLQQSIYSINDKDHQIDTLEIVKQALEAKLNDHYNDLQNKQQEIEEIVKKNGRVKQDLISRDQDLRTLRQTNSNLESEITKFKQQISTQSQEYEYLCNINSNLGRQIENIKKEQTRQQENQLKIEDELYKSRTTNNIINQDLEESKNKNELLSQQTKELNSNLMIMESKLHQQTMEIEELKISLQVKGEQIDDHKNKHQIIQLNLTEKQGSLYILEDQSKQLSDILQQKMNDFQVKQQEMDEFQRRLNYQKDQLNEKDNEIQNLKQKIQELNDKSQFMQYLLDQQQADLQNHQGDKERLVTLSDKQKNDAQVQNEEFNKVNLEKDRLAALLKIKEQEISVFKVNTDSFIDTQKKLNQIIVDLDFKTHSQELQKEGLKEQLAQKQVELNQKNTALQTTNNSLKEKEFSNNQLENHIKCITQKMDEYAKKGLAVEEDLNHTRKRLQKFTEDLDQSDSDKIQLKADNLELQQQFQQQKYQTDDQQIIIANITRALQMLKEDFDKKYKKLQDKSTETKKFLTKELTDLNKSKKDELSVASNNFQNLENQSNETQQQQAKDISDLQDKIISLEELKRYQYNELLSKFENYKVDKEEETLDLQTRLKELEDIYQKNTVSLTTYEQKRKQNKNEISNLRQEVANYLEKTQILEGNNSQLLYQVQDQKEDIAKLTLQLEKSKQESEKNNQYYNNREKEFKATKANLEKTVKDQDMNIISLNNNIQNLKQDIKSLKFNIQENEEVIIKLKNVQEKYFKLNKEMDLLTNRSREQEQELGDWRFKYGEFVLTNEKFKDLCMETVLYNVLIQSLRKQILSLKDDKEALELQLKSIVAPKDKKKSTSQIRGRGLEKKDSLILDFSVIQEDDFISGSNNRASQVLDVPRGSLK